MKIKTKEERVKIVIDIIKKLRYFPRSDFYHKNQDFKTTEDIYINLYNEEFPAIQKLKVVFNEYINQKDSEPNTMYSMSGKIEFEEINKYIEYLLPIKSYSNPIFALKKKS